MGDTASALGGRRTRLGVAALVAVGLLATVVVSRLGRPSGSEVGNHSGAWVDAKVEPVAALPAFPGAEGFGAAARGGRGGRVYVVEDLSDSGEPGTLRWAVEAEGPRIVVFRVGGTIKLESTLAITNPYITIAGQTAPGDGIALQDSTLAVNASEVIIRGLRIRPGDNDDGDRTVGTIRRGIDISTDPDDEPIHNVIIDHCSISWATDENLQFYARGGSITDVTVQWTIIAEALHDSIHIDEGATEPAPHSMGILADNVSRITVHHNLLAHNNDRNPRLNNVDRFEFLNNVVYNWGDGPFKAEGTSAVHAIGNYYRLGPGYRDGRSTSDIFIMTDTPGPGAAYLLAGNVRHSPDIIEPFTEREWNLVQGDTGPVEDPPVSGVPATADDLVGTPGGPAFTPSAVSIDTARAARDRVVAHSGAVVPARDGVDTRVVKDFVAMATGRLDNGGTIIDRPEDGVRYDGDGRDAGDGGVFAPDGHPLLLDSPAPADDDADGMADSWEIERGLDPANSADGAEDDDGDGYTNVEEYINGLIPVPSEG